MRWLPGRSFILVGDYQVATHGLCQFALRHAVAVTVVGRLRGDANLYAPPQGPPGRRRRGRKARKGPKLPSPARQAKALKAVSREVDWYGGRRRTVRLVSGTALWYDNR